MKIKKELNDMLKLKKKYTLPHKMIKYNVSNYSKDLYIKIIKIIHYNHLITIR